MLLAEKNEEQLNHLDQVITNQEFWCKNKFRLMNNEAASGKSQQTFKSIAKLALNTDKTIIYVQMFSNKNSEKDDLIELQNTVSKINEYAQKDVANYICKINQKHHKKILSNYNVICITHRRYYELCKNGNKKNFISNADVLIIDEFPNLFEGFYISELEELAKLQGFTLIDTKEKENIEGLTNFIKNKLYEIKENYPATNMKIVNLQKQDVKKYIKTLDIIITNAKKDNETAHKEIIKYAQRVIEILTHSSVYTMEQIGKKKYPVLYSYYKNINYILAKENNIVLDANGYFDGRYKLMGNLFQLDYQRRVFDYKDSYINLYPISTTKNALKKYKHIISDVVNYIDKNQDVGLNENNKYLIITDIAREKEITDYQNEVYETWNNVKITHFGALLGKNDWREYNNAWIIKTPFYRFIDYILQYMFYSRKDYNGNTDCDIHNFKGEYNTYIKFKNDKFNKFKNSIVLGEYYQAFKRIARDGRKCKFNILTADEDIYGELKKQFKNINERVITKFKLDYNEDPQKKTDRKSSKTNARNDIIKKYITEAKEQGKDKIDKSELCIISGIRKDKLSRQLKTIKPWMDNNNIEIGYGKEQTFIKISS